VQAAQKYAEWTGYLPANYTPGATITAKFIWACPNASTNSVVWGCSANSYIDSDPFDMAFSAGVEVTDANNANLDVNISNDTAAITIKQAAGAPAAGQLLCVRVYRLGSGADNLAASACLLQVVLTYT
jgi:hypothetical protein